MHIARGPGQSRGAEMPSACAGSGQLLRGAKKLSCGATAYVGFYPASPNRVKGTNCNGGPEKKSAVLFASHQLDSFLCLDSTRSVNFYTRKMVSISYSHRHHPTRSDPNQLQPARKMSSSLFGLIVLLNFRSKKINLPTIVSVVRFQKIVRGASLIFHLLAKDKIRSVSPPNINFMLTSSSSAASIADPFN